MARKERRVSTFSGIASNMQLAESILRDVLVDMEIRNSLSYLAPLQRLPIPFLRQPGLTTIAD